MALGISADNALHGLHRNIHAHVLQKKKMAVKQVSLHAYTDKVTEKSSAEL